MKIHSSTWHLKPETMEQYLVFRKDCQSIIMNPTKLFFPIIKKGAGAC